MKSINQFLLIVISLCFFCFHSFSQTNDSTFTNIDQALLAPLQVKILDLNNQNLIILPPDISKFQNLKTLILSGNPSLDLKATFLNLLPCKKLNVLYLANNNLNTLPKEVAALNNLESLYLSNNKISSIPAGMKNLNLKYIDLSNNNISDDNLTKIFRILPNPTTVNIGKTIPGQEDKSLKYYEEANKAVNIGQFLLADSLYTLSLSLLRHKDTYFNRAVVRRKLNDTKGYCSDLGSSSSLNDKEANHLYWKDCGAIDSVYYNKEGIPVKKGEHDYSEITSKSKYTTYMRFKRNDVANKILVHFEVINDDTIFYVTPNPPKYSEKEENIITMLVDSVLPTEKEKKGTFKTIIIISFIVLPNGDIDDVTAVSALGKSYNDRLVETLKKYIKKWEPAKFENKPVKYKKWINYYLDVSDQH